MAMSSRDNPQSGKTQSGAAGNPSGTAGRDSVDQAARDTHRTGQTNWAELDDRDLHNAAVDRGLSVNDVSRDQLIASLQAYDRDGAQGADAPAANHPATIEQRAAQDDKRREDAQNR